MPVLVYEKIRTGQFLLINRYRNKLVFIGKLNVIGLLLLGLTGYWYLNGTRYHTLVLEGLLGIMTTAKLDDRMYQVIDWSQKKGRLLVYVKRVATKASVRAYEV
jgi:fluoride ion exporter CrcB/FEX